MPLGHNPAVRLRTALTWLYQVSTRLANAGLPLSCGSGRDGAAAPSSPTKASRVPVEDHLKKVFAGVLSIELQTDCPA